NVDPVDGRAVYDGAFAHLSGGNWLAVNRWGDDGAPQAPYVRPNGVPVPAAELLTRPGSDPFLVEISSYTDYYRLRASRSAGPPPPASEHFNALPGVQLRVPLVDADAQPIGGVRLPDAELPLGRAEPVALSPCGTASIDDVCGNFGGWQPFAADELVARYGAP